MGTHIFKRSYFLALCIAEEMEKHIYSEEQLITFAMDKILATTC
jgi:hypothetical protein